MSREAVGRRGTSAAVITRPIGEDGRRTPIDERRRLVAESLNVGNPANNAKVLPEVADPRFECQLELAVDEIRPYERNPRRANNAKFDEIKESIRVCGIRNPLTVTRRPGERHFIVETGGNTRLIAIQQLWTETNEARFQRITVMYRPWRSESHVLIAHLTENEQRGELTYWDKANGIMALKGELQAERGQSLSLREMERELQELGFSVDKARLSRFQFAADKLKSLGEATSSLSSLDVKIIQPRLNLIARYAEKRAGMLEADLYAQLLDHVLQRHGDQFGRTRQFDVAEIVQDCEQSLADHFGVPITRLRIQLDALAKLPGLSFETLEAQTALAATPAPASLTEQIVPVAPTALSGVVTDNTQPAARIQDIVAKAPTTLLSVSSADTALNSSAEGVPGHSIGRSPGPGVETPSPESTVQPDLLRRLKESAIQFARLTDVADCLNFFAALPRGYYMEAPASPLDLEPDKPLRHRAWWLLALLSGQMHDALVLRMPETSHWRRAHVQDDADDPALQLLIENELGGLVQFDSSLADWLLDPTDEGATLFWELVLCVRELRMATPYDSSTGTELNAQETEG